MCNHRLLVCLHLVAVFFCIVFYYVPKERLTVTELLTEQCKYDTETLCPDCFPKPVNCDFFEQRVTFEGIDLLNFIGRNPNIVRIVLLDKERYVVIKNLNKNRTIETLRNSICDELDIAPDDCSLRNSEEFLHILRQRVLDENVRDGARICPPGDEKALARFVQRFHQPDLMKLLAIRTDISPLMKRMLSRRKLPVPSVLFQKGFSLVESHEGQALVNFFYSPLMTRMKIAHELINVILKLNEAVDQFRFYFTDISLNSIVANISPTGEVKVTLVNLKKLIILDTLSERLDPNKTTITHSRTECRGCFGYVQEDICTYSDSDINLLAVCQLFLENQFGNTGRGFLRNTNNTSEYMQLNKMLKHCVYCEPPNCENREGLLKQMQQVIHAIIN